MSDLQTPRPMDERRTTYLRLIAEICIAIVSVAAVALLGGPVVGILLPFILAFIMAWMFNPVIAWLQRHLRLTRKLFSYILVLVFYALLFGLSIYIVRLNFCSDLQAVPSLPVLLCCPAADVLPDMYFCQLSFHFLSHNTQLSSLRQVPGSFSPWSHPYKGDFSAA